MKTFKLNNNDQMPALGLGTWKSLRDKVYTTIIEAVKVGYRHIDCAYIYNNQAAIGHAINEVIGQGLVKREELWITSKLWNNSHREHEVGPALQQTLDELQLDYLDLYLMHWPIAFPSNIKHPENGSDFLSLDIVPLTETWKGMEAQVEKGLTKHIGVSNFNIPKLSLLLKNSNIAPEVNQVESHPYLQQNKLLKFCQENGIIYTGYSPLGSGSNDEKIESLLESNIIIEIAKIHNATPAQILLQWAIQRDTAVIPKTVQKNRLTENFNSQHISLSEKDLVNISSLEKGYRFIDGSFWMYENSPYTLNALWNQ